ncbi:MAG: hypothetical protein JWN40_1225 [Phycisphaerales bacterium]|nr:hypothetical protein [Phycisphaerales bacterium]
MRIAGLFILIVTATAAGFALGRSSSAISSSSSDSGRGGSHTTHLGLTVERLQPLSSLVTARVEVADVVETTLAGHTGSVKVAILVKGDFLLGTDLSAARFEGVDVNRRTATLVLTPPVAASPRVDHARTRVFAISTNGLWQVVPGVDEATTAVINRAYADAQRIVMAAADDRALLDRARRQAESVLRAFFAALGWTVAIRWGE